ncbi:MAG: tetratricopeptide repeat protein [Polyangiaceae bacterium]
MSSYDVYFAAPAGAEPPTLDAIRAWFTSRPRWEVSDTSAEYKNPLTGVDLDAMLEAPTGAPPERAPIVMWMKGLRAHTAIEEAADEFGAFAEAFGLVVVDDTDANTTRPFDRAWIRAQHEEFNRVHHEHLLGHLANDWDHVLERTRLDEVMAWNRRRDALGADAGEDVFVPQILFFEREGGVGTFVAWADGVAARVPEVDAIQTTRTFVPWSTVKDAIAKARRDADHFVVDGEALAEVFAAIEAADASPPPRIVRPRDVLTKDLVDAYLLPVDARAPRRKALELLQEARMASFMGKTEKEAIRSMVSAADLVPGDFSLQLEAAQFLHERAPAEAFRVADRAVALKPDSTFLALLGAANAMYAARWKDAIRLADHVLASEPGDRNAHLVRATALTELMRWDEAIAACDRALALETDAMAKNVKAFTWSAAGRIDEARALYAEALAELDRAIPQDPENADLHERRAYALLGLDRPDEAWASAQRALAIEPDALLAAVNAGRAAVERGRAADAVPILRKVLAKRKTSPLAARYLARAHAMLGQTSERDAALKWVASSPLQAHLAAADAVRASSKETVREVPSKAASRKKASPKKAPPKKPASKKASPKKASPKKASPKKASPKKAAPKRPASKKATPKKAAPKKPAPKKATPKKPTPKKPTPKKATPKKATPKKATPKKPAPKKASPKKGAPKGAAPKKTR